MEQLTVRPFWFSGSISKEKEFPFYSLPNNCSSFVPQEQLSYPNVFLVILEGLTRLADYLFSDHYSLLSFLYPRIRFFFDTRNEYRPLGGISYTSGSTSLRKSRLSLFFCLIPFHLLPFLITRSSYPSPGPSLFLLFGSGATWPPLAPWNILPSWKTPEAWASF
jgi:hypothetical protein